MRTLCSPCPSPSQLTRVPVILSKKVLVLVLLLVLRRMHHRGSSYPLMARNTDLRAVAVAAAVGAVTVLGCGVSTWRPVYVHPMVGYLFQTRKLCEFSISQFEVLRSSSIRRSCVAFFSQFVDYLNPFFHVCTELFRNGVARNTNLPSLATAGIDFSPSCPTDAACRPMDPNGTDPTAGGIKCTCPEGSNYADLYQVKGSGPCG